MIQEYYKIWHHHKTWTPGLWARLAKGAEAKPLLAQFGCPYSYYTESCFELSDNHEVYRNEFKRWFNIYMLDPYLPRDWVLRNDECRYIWMKRKSFDMGGCAIYIPEGIFSEPPPNEWDYRRSFRIYQNYHTQQWDIVEEGY